MKQIKTKSGNILCVEVPEYAYNFELDYHNYFPQVYVNFEVKNGILDIPLTDGNNLNNLKFKILGKLSELTDKDCEKLVENTVRCNSCDWEDYEDNLKTFVDMSEHVGKEIYYYKGCPNCETDDYLMDIVKESFISLLQSKGVDTSKEYLIIKIL